MGNDFLSERVTFFAPKKEASLELILDDRADGLGSIYLVFLAVLSISSPSEESLLGQRIARYTILGRNCGRRSSFGSLAK